MGSTHPTNPLLDFIEPQPRDSWQPNHVSSGMVSSANPESYGGDLNMSTDSLVLELHQNDDLFIPVVKQKEGA